MAILRELFVAILFWSFLLPFIVFPNADPAIQACLSVLTMVVVIVICALVDKAPREGHVRRPRRN